MNYYKINVENSLPPMEPIMERALMISNPLTEITLYPVRPICIVSSGALYMSN